jgi:tRNA(Ser,Leu) C12 N-acetylase TAN1
MAFKPQIRGLDKTISDLKKFGNKVEEALSVALETTAYDMEDFATKECERVIGKTSFTKLTGKLIQSIDVIVVNDMNYIVQAGGSLAPYAPYVEFGTGGLVNVPKEFDEQARRALGKGIKQVNLPPRPYMYPTLIYGRKQIEINLKKEIEQLKKAFK